MFKKTREGGFTLIELMIVVAIIGILAAVAIPRFADLVARAQEAATKGSLSSVRSALTIYYGGTGGTLPTHVDGVSADNNLDALVPTYIRQIPGGNIPEADLTWEVGENQGADWDNPVEKDAESGWAYSADEMHIWVPDETEDTAGDQYHTW